jgi:hypothetical protein
MQTFRLLIRLGLQFLGLTSLWAQSVPFGPVTDGVYLLAATPSGRSSDFFGAELYRFDAQGKLTLVREIVDTDPKRKLLERGIRFVVADYDSRVLVIGSPNVIVKRLDMVMMDSPAAPVSRALELPDLNSAPWDPWTTPRSPRDPRAASSSLIAVRLIESNAVKSLVLKYASDRGLVSAAIPFTAVGFGPQKYIPDSDMASLRVFGDFGLAELGYSDKRQVRTDRGRVVNPGGGGVGFDLGLSAPAALEGPKSDRRWLLAQTKQMSVLWEPPAPNASEESVLHVWTPQSSKWTQFRVPGDRPEVKAIGSWILGITSSGAKGRTSPGQIDRKKRKDNMDNPAKNDKDKSNAKPTQKRPDTDYWFRVAEKYYPGTLFAIDTATGRTIFLPTNQGDSEILLIRDDVVIYRVSDRLYSSRIQGTTVGAPQLIAQDEAVPDMHWAFSSR